MRILAISGSLRAQSVNRRVLTAAARLTPPGMEIALYDGLGSLPYFNPDLDTGEPPPAVADLRQQIGWSAGILICSPEYARGVPGAMKNALDWLVGSVEFPEKPVALINASQRSTDADAQLRLILKTMSARLAEDASITLPLLGNTPDADDIVSDPALSSQLRNALQSFARFIVAQGSG